MLDLNEIWVCEYSTSQQAFHVTTLKDSIETNLRMIVEKAGNDYQIFGIYNTAEAANRACDKMEKMQKQQELCKAAVNN